MTLVHLDRGSPASFRDLERRIQAAFPGDEIRALGGPEEGVTVEGSTQRERVLVARTPWIGVAVSLEGRGRRRAARLTFTVPDRRRRIALLASFLVPPLGAAIAFSLMLRARALTREVAEALTG